MERRSGAASDGLTMDHHQHKPGQALRDHMGEPFVSERRLVQVATVVNAVARSENWMVWESLVWLEQQTQLGHLCPTLYMPPYTAAENIYTASRAESLNTWRRLAAAAKRRKVDDLQMPSAASTWYVHAADLRTFAATVLVSQSTRDALLRIAKARLQVATTPTAAVLSPGVAGPTDGNGRPIGPAEKQEMRRMRKDGMSDREIGAKFGRSRTWAMNLIGSKVQNKIDANEDIRKRKPAAG